MTEIPWREINWTALASLITALDAGFVAFKVAQITTSREIQKTYLQVSLQQEAMVSTLRQRYITPLRFVAITLRDRLIDLETKHREHDYARVQAWFQEAKDHADGTRRKNNFPVWCCYEGIFVMTILYYTCAYFQSAREIMAKAPFSELEGTYGKQLEAALTKVRNSFGWGEDSFWFSIQDVIGERFTLGELRVEFEELCRLMDSQDPFRYAPFFRPIDVYIHNLDPHRAASVRSALDELVTFLDTQRTPESRRSIV
jgi:hypothetical protein